MKVLFISEIVFSPEKAIITINIFLLVRNTSVNDLGGIRELLWLKTFVLLGH